MNNELTTMIKKYRITISNNTGLCLSGKPTTTDINIIKSNKQEIIDIILEAKKTKTERENKINSIDGLKKLEVAIRENNDYSIQYEIFIRSEYIVKAPTKPITNVSELKKQYPRAAAYLIANSWCNASNVAKYTAGKIARERIINGENEKQVIADMEKEWSDYCNSKIMN